MPAVAPTVAVVIGSTRPRRICPEVAVWACSRLETTGGCRYQLLDLADFSLPLLDEPVMAARGEYLHNHTQRWSEVVSGFDGFLFVFPQYNWGYPAVLKNALDYLYNEWRDKPASTMTYGTRGGVKGADQLAQVLTGLHMRVLEHRIEAAIGAGDIDNNGALIDVSMTLAPVLDQVRAVGANFADVLAAR